MQPGLRKLILTLHIATSVGWVGAVLAYLPLDIATIASDEPATLRSAYVGMDLIARWVLVPLATAAFATGVLISLTTPWGLFRHYWVLISLILTGLALLVLVVETQTIRALAQASATATDDSLRALPSTLPHSIGGLIVLIVVLALNVYKPRGLTRYGWRKQQEEQKVR
jgi:uncharacterized membrane protein